VEEREAEDRTQYRVVINHEEQYSIWTAEKPNPPGWTDVGKSGTKDECLDYIEQVWTDMRPLSVRKHLAELQGQKQDRPPAAGPAGLAAD
jgi:MbtH protein